MNTSKGWRVLAYLTASAASAGPTACSQAPARPTVDDHRASTGRWVATWAASPQRADPGDPPLPVAGRTLRQILHVSLGGPRVRVRLSNAYGTTALVVGAAHVALHASGSAVQPGTDRALGFGGSPSVTIPPGALVVSDPVSLAVPALGDLAVSLYLPGAVTATTEHAVARATSYLSIAGDFTGADTVANATTTTSWHFIAGVDVETAPGAGAIIAFGDSITDGVGSSRNANRRWPNLLAERLFAAGPGSPRAVVSAGIAGNCLLRDHVGDSGLARFDRDVLTQAGALHVIVFQGIVDLGTGGGVTQDQLIVGHRQLIARAHAAGMKIIGATLTPFDGVTIRPGFYTAEHEARREAVNTWIRTAGEYDGVIDFDRVLRDPAHPTRLLPAFDSGDHLHPNDAGYQAMAGAIDLSLFDDSSPRVTSDAGHWFATWAASPQRADPDDPPLPAGGQTLRQTLHVSLGGPRVRVRLSNLYGTAALVVGSAHVALGAGGSSIQPGTDRVLAFGGSPSVAIPAGAHVVSDPVSLTVPALGDLAVSLYLPGPATATTEHVARATSYLSTAADVTAAGTLAQATTTPSWHFVSGVEVEGSPRARSIVAFGGSITDGVGSTPDANHRWPDLLAQRLAGRPAPRAVVNAGIAGNRLLSNLVGDNSLARFDRDVLAQAGTRYVIVLVGTNDVGVVAGMPDATVDQIIAGHRQLIVRAHALGMKVFGATLTPFEGARVAPGFYTTAGDAKRDTVNRWIRTSKDYDAVIDFDHVLRDPQHPARLLPAFDSGDHLHPNDAGYQAMADAIDLSLFDES